MTTKLRIRFDPEFHGILTDLFDATRDPDPNSLFQHQPYSPRRREGKHPYRQHPEELYADIAACRDADCQRSPDAGEQMGWNRADHIVQLHILQYPHAAQTHHPANRADDDPPNTASQYPVPQ